MRQAALVLMAAALWLGTGAAAWVQFQSLPADGSPGMTVTGLLRLPEGSGPFPAVVLLPDCDGISPHEREWGVRFAEAGYVAYLIDSLFTRALESGCGAEVPVADDARGAIARLATLDEVDPARIAVVGWQSGGDVALALAEEDTWGMAAAVAFYPSCAGLETLRRPAAVVAPGEACLDWSQRQDVARLVAAGAGPGFDCERCAGGYMDGPGGWDPAVFEEAEALLYDTLAGMLATD